VQNNVNQTKHERRPRRWLKWIGVVVIFFALVAAGIFFWAMQELRPTGEGDRVTLNVRPGETSAQIALKMEELGLIRNAFLFRFYLSLHHDGRMMQAGKYEMTPGTAISELIAQLQSGRVVVQTIRVTIPEGFTVEQIAARLDELHVCATASFMAEVKTGKYTEPFLSQLKADAKIRDRLEGYLFPDTYEFVQGESAHQIVDEMLHNFQTHLTANVQAQINQRHLTLAAVVTEASMVEKEAKVNFERPIIASVMDNRLNHQPPMKLQIDATVLYVVGHHNVVTDADTLVKSPYNTYQNYGLPPGPIANPGVASILAVLKPAQTKYLYYVVKNDGTGEDYFAATWSEQLPKIALSQANRQKYGH